MLKPAGKLQTVVNAFDAWSSGAALLVGPVFVSD